MVDDILGIHLNRLRASVIGRHSAATVAKWIQDNTTLAMMPFSFIDHEYQERILSDTSQHVVVRKCSQVGISEVSVRMSLALVNIITPYTLAYTLPTAAFSATFAKTRVDTVINGSASMKAAIHRTNDNTEIKQFGESFLYLKGAASSNAPISIPCDHLVHDEVDFSDQEVLGQYTSRLTHSKWKRTHKFSTPTLPNFGIDREFQGSRRHFLMCKCSCCAKWFLPDYYKHVRVPGFNEDLHVMNKAMLSMCGWRQAFVECPHCGGRPLLSMKYREWVCENPEENHEAAGYQVSPFDAPNIISPSYLVEASTKYERRQDFDNFNLGLPSEDSESTIVARDFEGVFISTDAYTGAMYVMGVDVGAVYHFVVGAVDAWGDITAVHSEMVPMGQARKRYRELRMQFRIICTVMDSLPHSETLMALQDEDPNLYASVYVRSKSVLTHLLIDKDSDSDKGRDFLRQVNVNRNRALDAYMNFLREGHLRIRNNENRDLIVQHHMSMKRVKTYEHESGELQFTWQKTDGNDHFHHAFLYVWVASKIRGVARNVIALPVAGMSSFRVKATV